MKQDAVHAAPADTPDSMTSGVDMYFGYLPVGILGLVRWASWIFRRIVAHRYRPHEGEFNADLAVVSPVYQEDPEIFERAVRSWLANPAVTEVVCVIDTSDEVCWAIAERLQAEDPRVMSVPTTVPGKRDALRVGWEHSHAEIVALVDSDTIWATDVGAEALRPFSDPEVGGVATRQNVWKPASLWEHLTDFYLDYRYYDENAAQTAWGQALSCLSGRTALYRREILLEISEEFIAETFMGVPCNSGDDKRLTTLTLERGHRTYMQRSARVWSTFPDTGRQFFRQRLRWSRNTWRSDLRALSAGWVFRHPYLAFTLIDKSISPFTSLIAPLFFLIAVFRGDLTIVVLMLTWWLVSRGFKNLQHLREQPEDILLVPMLILVSFALAVTRIQALFTIRTQRWLTRDVAVVNGELMRTGTAVTATSPQESSAAA